MSVQLCGHCLTSYLTGQLTNLTTAIAQAEPAVIKIMKTTVNGLRKANTSSKIKTTHIP